MPELSPPDPLTERTDEQPTLVGSVRPAAPLRRGDVVNGRYRLEDIIGSGGFGQVFRARDEMLDRIVAVKTLHRRVMQSEANLIEEARTIARLDHPNIVPVYDVGVADGTAWMAMKMIDGTSLNQILHHGRLEPKRAITIVAQAAQALDHAHRRGIVHRDVKPSNILITSGDDGSEHVWLADFGIARMLSGDTGSSAEVIAGTPAYMAPEQITGKRIDARSDVFALGCVASEAITGRRCFSGGSFTELMYKIVHEPPAGVGEIGALAGDSAEAVIRRALAKSPEDRFQTAEELGRHLLKPPSVVPRLRVKRLFRRDEETTWDGREVIVARDLWKGYGWRRHVVRGVDLTVPRGAIYALLGRNGSGKTTLIRTLLGLYRRDRGEVRLFGRDPQRHASAILGRIGFVAETLPVYDSLRVGELFHLLSLTYADWDSTFAYNLLGRFQLPMEARVKTLSRGMRTQLGLVTALAHRPELLVLDDPTLGLDAVVLDDFFATLADTSRREGTTVLMASHNIAEMENIASHVGLFSDGRIVLADSLAGLRTRTREVTVTFADDVPAMARSIADLKMIRTEGRHLTGFVLDESSGAIERLKALGPAELIVRELTLKEIFVNFMRDA